jgi:hypothetical protein
MAIQTITLDPAAVGLSDDEVVAKINSASTTISRAGAVTAAARPIAAGEVGATEIAAGAVQAAKLASGVAKSNLDAMSATERGYIATDPAVGAFPIIGLSRSATGKIDVKYDDVPKS